MFIPLFSQIRIGFLLGLQKIPDQILITLNVLNMSDFPLILIPNRPHVHVLSLLQIGSHSVDNIHLGLLLTLDGIKLNQLTHLLDQTVGHRADALSSHQSDVNVSR